MSETESDRSATLSPREGEPRRVVDLGDMIAILFRRAGLVAMVLAGVLALAMAYALTAKPYYTASVSLLVDARSRTPVGSENVLPTTFPDNALVESQVKIISSDTVLRRVVEAENLAEDPEFGVSGPGLRTRLMMLLGLVSGTDVRRDAEEAALAKLARQIRVQRSERTYVIDVEVTAASGEKAARLANGVARAYIEDIDAASNENARRDADWLKGRLEELQARVQDAERRVEQYKSDNNLVNANGKLIGEQQLVDLSTQMVQAQARLAEAQARHQQVQRVLGTGRAEAVTDVLKSPVIEQLRQQYAEIARQEANYRTTLGARHPAMQEVQQQLRDTRRLIDEEVRRIAGGLANDVQAARANAAALTRQLETAKTASSATGQTMVRLRELEREADASRVVYERFLRARENVNPDSYEAPLARVIAPATAPAGATGPKRLLILVMAMAVGLGLGAGVAFVAEYAARTGLRLPLPSRAKAPSAALPLHDPDILAVFSIAPSDPRANHPSSLWARMTGLGKAGALQGDASARLSLSACVPAFESLLDALESRAHRRAPRSLLVTSRERRATQAAFCGALAARAAARGQRVLILNAGTRDGALLSLADSAAPAALLEQGGRTYVLRQALAAGVDLACMSAEDVRAAMRLSRDPSVARVKGVEGHYDFIIHDAPVIGSAETAALGGKVDQALAILWQAEADAGTIDAIFDALAVEQDVFAGVVLIEETQPAAAADAGRRRLAAA